MCAGALHVSPPPHLFPCKIKNKEPGVWWSKYASDLNGSTLERRVSIKGGCAITISATDGPPSQ